MLNIQKLRNHEPSIIAYLLGLSIFLYAIHAKFMVVRNGAGEAIIFLPMFGVLLWLVCFQWSFLTQRFHINWRPLWVTFPIIIILISMIARICIEQTSSTVAELLFIVIFVAIYYMTRSYGLNVLKPLLYATILEALSVLIYSVFVGRWHTEDMTNGGLLSETNYDVATGFMAIGLIIGVLLIKNTRYLILYSILVVTAMLMTGSPESLFALGVLGVYLLTVHRIALKTLILRHRRMLLGIAGVLSCMVLLWVSLGGGKATAQRTKDVLGNTVDITDDYPDYGQGRFPAYERVLQNVDIFGHGFTLTHYRVDDSGVPLEEMDREAQGIAHNVPLVIVEQIGPIAAAAWLVVTIYCFKISSRKMRIMWVIVASLCVFDHYIWTTIAPYWWLLIGITLWEVDNALCKREMENIYNNTGCQTT